MSYRAYVSQDFARDTYSVHIAHVGNKTSVVEPTDLVLSEVPDGISTPPAFQLNPELARALFDALGVALNVYTPDARLAAEVLAREQERVDKMLDHLIR
jgi:hypothetical protein